MIFKRRKSAVRLFRHTSTPGLKIGRYENGLDAIWAWEQCAHLLVVERSSYGAGENLVRLMARKYEGERVQLDPKVLRDEDYYQRDTRALWWHISLTSCATQVARLNLIALERAARVEQGENVAPLLVTIPELHDVLEAARLPVSWDEGEAGKALLAGIRRLLMVARAGRIRVLANLRQGYFYQAYLPRELLNHFSGRLVLGTTDRITTELLGLPKPFDRPYARLGDLEDGFWPLEVRHK